MKNPEQYQKKYVRSAKTKLFIPRNIEGKPNQEIFPVIRALEEELSSNPYFIGVGPYGSKIKGYSKESSDLDVAVFHDVPEDNDFSSERSRLHTGSFEVSNEFGGPDKIHIEHYDLNRGRVKETIRNPNYYPGRFALAHFFGPVSGPRVDELRTFIAQEVQTLPVEKRTAFVNQTVNDILGFESSRASQINERMSVPAKKNTELAEARKELWKKRITKALDI